MNCYHCSQEFEPNQIYCSSKCRVASWKATAPRGYWKKPIPMDVRIAVYRRDNFKCKQCSSETKLSIDHIVPESKGGSMDVENLQTLCWPCNKKKGNRPTGYQKIERTREEINRLRRERERRRNESGKTIEIKNPQNRPDSVFQSPRSVLRVKQNADGEFINTPGFVNPKYDYQKGYEEPAIDL